MASLYNLRMLTLGVKTNLDPIAKAFGQMAQKQVPFALSLTINRLADFAKDDLRAEMAKVFDRPKPYTLNSLRIKRASKSNLTAVVYHSDVISRYLEPEIEGGARGPKRFESLAGLGLLIPGGGVRLDRYGNIPRSVIAKLKQKGYDPNGLFIVKPGSSSHLKPGIYQRKQYKTKITGRKGSKVATAGARTLIPLMLFTSSITYRKRYDMEKVAQKVIAEHFDGQFNGSMDYALRTANLNIRGL